MNFSKYIYPVSCFSDIWIGSGDNTRYYFSFHQTKKKNLPDLFLAFNDESSLDKAKRSDSSLF